MIVSEKKKRMTLSISCISRETIIRFSSSGQSNACDTEVPPPKGIITTFNESKQKKKEIVK
jgi:hypothetical protein